MSEEIFQKWQSIKYARNAHWQVHLTERVSFARAYLWAYKRKTRISHVCTPRAPLLCVLFLAATAACVRQVESQPPMSPYARARPQTERRCRKNSRSSLSWAASGVDPVLPQQVALSAAVATLFFYYIYLQAGRLICCCKMPSSSLCWRTTFYQLIVRGNWRRRRPHHLCSAPCVSSHARGVDQQPGWLVGWWKPQGGSCFTHTLCCPG